MTPEQFLDRVGKKGGESAYLFLGPESYNRERCRRALIDAIFDPALPPEDREAGFTRHDLDQIALTSALDDARSMSLFATRRLIWLARAESALPRGKAIDTEEEGGGSGGATAALESYLRRPTPGTTIVIDAARLDFDGEDKARMERVRKFYAAVTAQVEFRPFSPEAARALAQSLARAAGLQLGLSELALLLDATGGDAARIAVEIEKLKLLAGSRKVTADDIAALVPDAQATTVFALVAALGRGDRSRALETLDTLARAGEYMPLALTFLATQFRMALAAREAGLRGAGEIQAHFSKLGARIWPERAREIGQTVEAFPKARLERAVAKLFEADRDLRDARPDDRIVMEEMILELTAR
jgi:DNA polymerase III subunit delta